VAPPAYVCQTTFALRRHNHVIRSRSNLPRENAMLSDQSASAPELLRPLLPACLPAFSAAALKVRWLLGERRYGACQGERGQERGEAV